MKMSHAKDTNNLYVSSAKGCILVFFWNLTSHQHLIEPIIPFFTKHSSISIYSTMLFLFFLYFLSHLISFSGVVKINPENKQSF